MSSTSVDALKSQLQSARKAMLFMETEHAKTLHGLHSEIKSLQKKCNELAFQIVVQEDEAYIAEAKTSIETLIEDAASSAEEKVALIQQLEEKDKRILDLEHNYKTREMSYMNEIKAKNYKVTSLTKELDLRATTIAYLTTQLHQAHSKLQIIKENEKTLQPQTNSQEPAIPAYEPTISPDRPATGRHLTPTPPTEGRKSSRRIIHRDEKSRSGEIKRVQSINGSLLSEGGNIRPLSSSSDSPRDSLSPRTTSLTRVKVTSAFGNITPSIPDPTPFLMSSKKRSVVNVKKYVEIQPSTSRKHNVYNRSSSSRTVLPPISKQTSDVDDWDLCSKRSSETDLLDRGKDVENAARMFRGSRPRKIKSTSTTVYDVPIADVCTPPEASKAKRGVHKT